MIAIDTNTLVWLASCRAAVLTTEARWEAIADAVEVNIQNIRPRRS